MQIEAVGDSLLIVRDFPGRAWSLAEWIDQQNMNGIIETVPAYETVGVIIDPLNPPNLEPILNRYTPTDTAQDPQKKLKTVRVCFEMGEDLQQACQKLGLSQSQFILEFTDHTFDCYAVGFQPGFPYLGWLPKNLQGLERHPTPRIRVPAGAVAITGKQVGIYPQESPGGWQLVGRTPDQIVDLENKSTLIAPGDIVRFVRISPNQFQEDVP